MLDRLRVRQFRNIRQADLTLAPGVNWLVGANAAGKTAVVEAVYCLSRGRSFRGKRHGPLALRGTEGARVEGWFSADDGARSAVEWTLRLGSGIERVPPLGECSHPVRLICDATHALVEGEPSLRRRFLDWNVSLSMPGAIDVLGRFRRISAQRNAWLRAGGRGRPVWDQPYASALSQVFALRRRFLARLDERFQTVAQVWGSLAGLKVDWDGPDADAIGLATRLDEMRQGDRERGFTYLGASRSDFVFRYEGVRWAGSRGQGKVVGVLLQIAAEDVVSRERGARAIWLVDDLDAELTSEWSGRLLTLLREHSDQMLVTALPGKMAPAKDEPVADTMFHVEHGAVRTAG